LIGLSFVAAGMGSLSQDWEDTLQYRYVSALNGRPGGTPRYFD
jgi:hypothetical protein